MTALRNLAALPMVLLALGLYYMADGLARLSQVSGNAANAVMGAPKR